MVVVMTKIEMKRITDATKFAGLIVAVLMMTTMFGISQQSTTLPNQKIVSATTEDGERQAASIPKPPIVKASTTPIPGVPLPPNAIKTPNGGYVTIPHPTDENGNTIKLTYEVGTEGSGGYIVPACRGPTQGLYQEGNDWIVTANSQRIGAEETWTFPTGTVSGTSVGFFYNPVNFYYPISSPNYDFFQVDYGLGNNLKTRAGWIMTYSYIASNGTRLYPFTNMAAITVSPGSTYKVDAMLQPYPLANPPAYVVQVTLGTNGWLYSKPLGYAPALGSVNTFKTYNDEWLLSSGSSTLSSDTNASPKIIKDVNNALVYDGTLVTGMTSKDQINTAATTASTRDILSPSPLNTTPYNDIRECSSWT